MKLLKCFMMTQFESEHQSAIVEKIRETIDRINSTAKEYSIELTSADSKLSVGMSSAEEHFRKFIDDCDFAIVGINHLDSDVTFGIDYAAAQDKPVIVMLQSDPAILVDFERGALTP